MAPFRPVGRRAPDGFPEARGPPLTTFPDQCSWTAHSTARPGGYPGWTDPKVCARIDDEAACNDHPVCRWHPAHEECVPE